MITCTHTYLTCICAHTQVLHTGKDSQHIMLSLMYACIHHMHSCIRTGTLCVRLHIKYTAHAHIQKTLTFVKITQIHRNCSSPKDTHKQTHTYPKTRIEARYKSSHTNSHTHNKNRDEYLSKEIHGVHRRASSRTARVRLPRISRHGITQYNKSKGKEIWI
jgi:hypothetical protein